MSRGGRIGTGETGRRRRRSPGRRAPRPAEMRRRADEMVALLGEAAPRAARGRRRRATAAVVAFGALSIGGVGLALGLTPTGIEGILPASPAPALADPASPLATTPDDAAGAARGGSVAGPAVAGADLMRTGDHRSSAGAVTPAAVGHRPDPITARAPRPASRRAPPTSTRLRSTSSRPTPTTARSATPRSTATGPATTRTSAAAPRPAAQRSSLPATAAGHRSAANPAPQAPTTSGMPSRTDGDPPQE